MNSKSDPALFYLRLLYDISQFCLCKASLSCFSAKMLIHVSHVTCVVLLLSHIYLRFFPNQKIFIITYSNAISSQIIFLSESIFQVLYLPPIVLLTSIFFYLISNSLLFILKRIFSTSFSRELIGTGIIGFRFYWSFSLGDWNDSPTSFWSFLFWHLHIFSVVKLFTYSNPKRMFQAQSIFNLFYYWLPFFSISAIVPCYLF